LDAEEKLVSEVLMCVDGFHSAHTMNPNLTIAIVFTPAVTFEKYLKTKVPPQHAGTQIVGIEASIARRTKEMQNRQQNQASLD